MDVGVELGDVGGGQAQVGGELAGGRGAPEGAGEGLVGAGQAAGVGPHAAGGPVDGAQLVQDGAADAVGGVAVEGDAVGGVVGAGGLGQAEHAGADEVVAGYVGGQAGQGLGHHVADQGQGGAHERVLVNGRGAGGGGVDGGGAGGLGLKRGVHA